MYTSTQCVVTIIIHYIIKRHVEYLKPRYTLSSDSYVFWIVVHARAASRLC